MEGEKEEPKKAKLLLESENADLRERIMRIEQALLEYVEMYGLTEKARAAMRNQK